MRTLILLLVLASGFGLAALWQSRHMEQLRAEQREAWQIADGELAETESGTLEDGWAMVVMGAPSGAQAVEFDVADPVRPSASLGPAAEPVESTGPATEPAGDEPLEPPALGDFEMEVQPGQTLSGIAHAHYGTAPTALVQALADYNGIEDPDALRAGAWVLLPERERLTGTE